MGPSTSNGLRAKAELALLRFVRAYTYNTPIQKGRHRAYLIALGLCRERHRALHAQTHDGRVFSADLSTGMQTTLYFLGEYERAITEIVEKVIQRNNFRSFLDIGANFGWYTTLFHKYAADDGQVHGFEPVPVVFENLCKNVALLGDPPNVIVNQLALGDENKEVTINLFDGLATGHASLSDQGRSDARSFICRMLRLDDYLVEQHVKSVDFVKADIEGAELGMLKGSERLFQQEDPPVFLMEMALNQTKNFDYLPNDLITYIRARGTYRFFAIDEVRTGLVEIEGFDPDDIGANVLCIPNKIADRSVAGILASTPR